MKMRFLLISSLVILPSAFAMAISRSGKLPGYTDSSACPSSYVEQFACRQGEGSYGGNVTAVLCQNGEGESVLISKTPGLHDSGFYIQKTKKVTFSHRTGLTVVGLSYSGGELNNLWVADNVMMFESIRVDLNTCM